MEIGGKHPLFMPLLVALSPICNLTNPVIKDDKNTQTSYIGVVVVYGIVAIEAFVDAHLQNFDISDDLSIKVKMPGLQFVYTF
jgi:hypothetical protein